MFKSRDNYNMQEKELTYLPCYYLFKNNQRVAFICSLVFTKEGREILPPITDKTLDELYDITKKEGLLITRIYRSNEIPNKITESLTKIEKIKFKANILFLFPNQDIAEEFLLYINKDYKIELIKRT